MKKETLSEIVLGTVGGLIFAIGMCMTLIPEWNLFNAGVVVSIGVVGALVMGFGMSRVMVDSPAQSDIIVGIVAGIIGLLVCVLNYPIYSYIKSSKNDN